MKDKQYKALKKKLRALAEKWVHGVGLGTWKVHLEYARDDYEPTGAHVAGMTSVAHNLVDWRYQEATITFNMPALAQQADDEIEYFFVHEICHILVREMRGNQDDSMDHEERVVTSLAKAFLWMQARK